MQLSFPHRPTKLFAISVAAFNMLLSGAALAQDSRQVREPQAPAVCAVLSAQLDSGKPDSVTAKAPDTTRLQAAIDACKPGQAVRLSSRNGKAAFLAGSLQLRNGVALMLDAGVTLYA